MENHRVQENPDWNQVEADSVKPTIVGRVSQRAFAPCPQELTFGYQEQLLDQSLTFGENTSIGLEALEAF